MTKKDQKDARFRPVVRSSRKKVIKPTINNPGNQKIYLEMGLNSNDEIIFDELQAKNIKKELLDEIILDDRIRDIKIEIDDTNNPNFQLNMSIYLKETESKLDLYKLTLSLAKTRILKALSKFGLQELLTTNCPDCKVSFSLQLDFCPNCGFQLEY